MDLHECVGRVGAVTVRRIRFIDDPNPSVGDHPLYALLVSLEPEEE
jgi:hypothetical protein